MTLVLYDTPDDRVRERLAEACKDHGLQRTQYSVFVGPLSHERRRALQRRLRRELGDKEGNVQVWAICPRDCRLHFEIDQGSGSVPYSARYG